MDDDVLALVDSVTDFLERRGDARAIAEASAESTAAQRRRWEALCELGLPVFRLAEPVGIGASLLEAAAVAERLGAVLLPEPAAAAIVLADCWAAHPEADQLLRSLISGTHLTRLSAFDAITLTPDGAVNGQLHLIDDGISDTTAALAHDEFTGGSALVVLNNAELPAAANRNTLDPTRPIASIHIAEFEPADIVRLADADATRMRRELAVLYCAELVGGMQQTLSCTVEFVAARKQFGRSIGSFQAVKHRLADVYTRTEQARALVQLAALTAAEGDDSADEVVASMTRWVPRSAIDVSEAAIHLHGAMGFSWEVAMHLHLRRALVMRLVLNNFGIRGNDGLPQLVKAV